MRWAGLRMGGLGFMGGGLGKVGPDQVEIIRAKVFARDLLICSYLNGRTAMRRHRPLAGHPAGQVRGVSADSLRKLTQ